LPSSKEEMLDKDAVFALRATRLTSLGKVEVTVTFDPGQNMLQAPDSWRKLTPEGEGFSVLLPGEPKEEKEGVLVKGAMVHSIAWRLDYHDGREFFIHKNDNPGVVNPGILPEVYFDQIRNDIIEKEGMKLLSEKSISHYLHPGREMTFERSDGFTFVRRCYLVGKYSFTLAVSHPKGSYPSQSTTAFFDSFRLLP
jgi:hypothetical protein